MTLGANGTESTDERMRYLSLILSGDLPPEARKREPEKQYRIGMNREMKGQSGGDGKERRKNRPHRLRGGCL